MVPMLKLNGIPGRLDMVLRFESLESDFVSLTARLGIRNGVTLPHRNKGYASEDWYHYYAICPNLVDVVAQRFHEDIQMYGYDFAIP